MNQLALLPAASLAAGPPATGLTTHHTAAYLHGLPLIRPWPTPAVTVPSGHRAKLPGWQMHWSDVPPADIVVTPDGFAVTGLVRTLVDCGRTMPLHDVVAMMDAALHDGRVTRAELGRAVLAARGRGVDNVRRAFRWSDSRAMSAQESVGRVALCLAGMPAEPSSTWTVIPARTRSTWRCPGRARWSTCSRRRTTQAGRTCCGTSAITTR